METTTGTSQLDSNRNKLASRAPLNFIISGFLPFAILDNFHRNIIKAVKDLEVFLLRCLGHTINLIVKRILDHKPKRHLTQTSSQMASANAHSGMMIFKN
jgi:hypothetical protein